MDISNRVIGFIGLGAMGSRMAKRLIAAGFKVVVFDRTRAKKKLLAAQGAAMAPNPRTLAMESDVIISCLSNDDAVRSVYEGDEGVFAAATPGSIVIEMSTISPETSRELARDGEAHGVECSMSRFPEALRWRRAAHSRSWVAAAKRPSRTARRFSASWPSSISIWDPAAAARR